MFVLNKDTLINLDRVLMITVVENTIRIITAGTDNLTSRLSCEKPYGWQGLATFSTAALAEETFRKIATALACGDKLFKIKEA